MREILFKAKRKDNDEWVEGYYVKVTDIYTSFADFNKKVGDYILRKGNMLIEVISETLSQYTGLTDKNGVKIFENDKLLYRSTIYLDVKEDFVFYNEDYGTFEVAIDGDKENSEILGFYLSEIDYSTTDYEVIGNIFDEGVIK